jgi:hypothetical protein
MYSIEFHAVQKGELERQGCLVHANEEVRPQDIPYVKDSESGSSGICIYSS